MVGPIVFVSLPAQPIRNSVGYEIADYKESRGDQKEREVVKHVVGQLACSSNGVNESRTQLEENSNASSTDLCLLL